MSVIGDTLAKRRPTENALQGWLPSTRHVGSRRGISALEASLDRAAPTPPCAAEAMNIRSRSGADTAEPKSPTKASTDCPRPFHRGIARCACPTDLSEAALRKAEVGSLFAQPATEIAGWRRSGVSVDALPLTHSVAINLIEWGHRLGTCCGWRQTR